MTDHETTTTDFLLVDDDENLLHVLSRALQKRGYSVVTATDADKALRAIATHPAHRAVVDLKMDGPSGLSLIPQLKARLPDMEIVILTGYSSIATAVEAMRLGAANYLCKPANTTEILAAFDLQAPAPDIEIPEHPPSVDRVEWEHIQRVLQEHDGNISATARALGMHRRTLQRKLQKRPVKR